MWFLLAALNKCLFMKFAPEIFFDALLARSGRSKNSFSYFLGFFVDILVDLHTNKSYYRRGSSK